MLFKPVVLKVIYIKASSMDHDLRFVVLAFLKQFTPFWFGNCFILIGAVPASVSTAMTLFQMVFFSKNRIAIFIIKIHAFN